MEELRRHHPENWYRTFKSGLRRQFLSREEPGIALVENQSPHPFGELLKTDPVNGRALFRNTVRIAFKGLLDELP